jgi:similar to stage IV sporulation protein
MLLSLIKYTRGYVCVRLTGYAPERFLNLCGNRDIFIWNLKPCEEGYEFCLSVEDFRHIKPLLKKTRTRVHILGKQGLPFRLYRYRKHKFFAAGLAMLCVLLYCLSGYVWNIEVNGNSYLSEETVLDFLVSENCSFGTKKKDIDCAALEEALRSRYDEVIWTSIKLYGTKMTVDIQENLLPEENYTVKEDEIYDITATEDGIIRQMVTRSGTPLVAVGDTIAAGDILVSGCLKITDDNGEAVSYLYQSADADIAAEVVYAYEDVIAAEYVRQVPTGAQKMTYTLCFFDKIIKNPFFQVDFAHDTVYADTTQFHFTDNFYLPIYLTKLTYTEYRNEKKTRTKEEAKEIAEENLFNYISKLEEKGIQILEKNVIIEKENQSYVARGTVTVLQSIVNRQPAEISEITGERQLMDESD